MPISRTVGSGLSRIVVSWHDDAADLDKSCAADFGDERVPYLSRQAAENDDNLFDVAWQPPGSSVRPQLDRCTPCSAQPLGAEGASG